MRLIILDRDGVINEDSDAYIKSPDEWQPIPGSLEAIAQLCHADYHVIIATNQSGIGRHFFNTDTLNCIHNKMIEEIQHRGGDVDAIFFCPHAPEAGCKCRKPQPGLFEEIASRLKTNLNGTFAVGDSLRDIEAAQRAHALPVLVRTGKGHTTVETGVGLEGVPIFDDLAAFTKALLSGQLSGPP